MTCHCGSEFSPRNVRHKFCSKYCKDRVQRTRDRRVKVKKTTYFVMDEKVHGLLDELYEEYGSWPIVSFNTKVPERSLYRLVHFNKRVSLDTLDKLTLNTRHHLWEFEEV